MYSDNYFKALRKLANDNGRIGVPAVTPQQKPVQPVKTLPDVSKDPTVQAGLDAYKKQLDATSPLNTASAGPVERLDMSDVGLSLSSLPEQLQDTVRREQRKEILTRKPQDRRTPEQVAQKVVYGTDENTTAAQHLANAEQSRRESARLQRSINALDSMPSSARSSGGRPAAAAPGSGGRFNNANNRSTDVPGVFLDTKGRYVDETGSPISRDRVRSLQLQHERQQAQLAARQGNGSAGMEQAQPTGDAAAQTQQAGKVYKDDWQTDKRTNARKLDWSKGHREGSIWVDDVTGYRYTARELYSWGAPPWQPNGAGQSGQQQPEPEQTNSIAQDGTPAQVGATVNTTQPTQANGTPAPTPPTPQESVAEAPAMSYRTPAQVGATVNTPPPTPQEPVNEAPAMFYRTPAQVGATVNTTQPTQANGTPAPTPPSETVAEAPAAANDEAENGARRALDSVVDPDREQEVASNQMTGSSGEETAQPVSGSGGARYVAQQVEGVKPGQFMRMGPNGELGEVAIFSPEREVQVWGTLNSGELPDQRAIQSILSAGNGPRAMELKRMLADAMRADRQRRLLDQRQLEQRAKLPPEELRRQLTQGWRSRM